MVVGSKMPGAIRGYCADLRRGGCVLDRAFEACADLGFSRGR